MVACQVLLLVFTIQWLHTQYTNQSEELKGGLTKLFTDVQHDISDSLLLTNAAGAKGHVQPFFKQADGVTDTNHYTTLSPAGVHRIIASLANVSGADEKRLFGMDTIVFNDIFTSQMKHNGWNFHSKWISNVDSDTKAGRNIFIRSNFFTHENGVVIDNYRWYLVKAIMPQVFFIMVLLALTAIAFRVTYKSLKAQIKLSALKDDFISNMSHELKTPIATVKLALEALNNFNIIEQPQQSREYLGMASAEMDRLELMATRVLNTSLLDSGKLQMQQETYDLKRLVTETIQAMQLRIEKHSATITFDAPAADFLIPIDKFHLQGVLINLIDNSLKYGEQPVHINIQLTQTGDRLQLAFTDNGPGIPEEYKEKVFEKFFRIPTGNRHNAKGYGLGLSYVAQVMRLHNGSIDVNNAAQGGCVFTLTF